MSRENIACTHREQVTKLCNITICSDGTIGLHLSRTPWDPYPWVRGVQHNSGAFLAGVRDGDVVLEVNGHDVLGQKISELANIVRTHWQNGGRIVKFLVWRNKIDQKVINQQSLQKFASCLQNIAQLLECPICLEVVKPPGWQCCNGHVLCNSCRGRTHKCPVCRVSLGPRGRCLLSDKLFTLLAESFPCDVKTNGNETSCHDTTLTTDSCTSASGCRPQLPSSGSSFEQQPSPKSEIEQKQIISKSSVDVRIAQTKTNSSYSIKDRIYHCPTGKSCIENDINSSGGGGESCRLYSRWSVLTHLQRHHDMPVCQYYGCFGELIPIELHDNSISGITLKLATNPTPNQSFLLELEDEKEFQQNIFFIVKIPLNDTDTNVDGRSSSISSNSSTNSRGSCHSCCSSSGGSNLSSNNGGKNRLGSYSANDGNVADPGENPALSNPATTTTTTTTLNEGKKYAIFIWYCGNDEDVQKFRTKIECLYPKLKWKGKVHPLTESWNSIKRKKEFLVVNGDTFKYFEIVIKLK